jgi:hypothetical protein
MLLVDGNPPTPDMASETVEMIIAGLKSGAVTPGA